MSKRKIKRRKRKLFKFVKYIFLALLSILIITIGFLFLKFYPNLKNCKEEANKIITQINKNDFKIAGNSHVYDANGEELFEIKSDKDLEYLPFSKIPQYVKDAFISVEDKRFYEHNGIDYKSLLRASIALIKNNGEITQGGSTITQQLVKLTYLSSEQTYTRKIKEILIAKALEKKFTKEQILEFYINNIYFNNNAYGINAASYKYFNKDISQLSLAEITFLCAIPNNPTLYDPITNKNNTIERQHKILKDMLETNSISKEEYTKAIKQEIVLNIQENIKENDTRKDFVTKELCELLMKEKGFKFNYTFTTYEEKEKYKENYNNAYSNALREVYKFGYNIYTSFDNNLQKETQNIIDTTFMNENEISESGIYQLQAASVTIENSTGLIKTMIGGRTSNITDYLDRSYNIYRQNGSTMKPIAVYGPAFDLLGYVPSTIKNDAREINGPYNSSGYYGNISIRKAIQISSNTIAYKVFREVTPEKGLAYLQQMQFENIVPDDFRLTSALGGLTNGTNPKEMAIAYATIANEGQFNPAKCIVSIKNTNGETIYTHTPINKKVYKESSAAMLTDVLKDVLTVGTAAGNTLNNNIECAGKTGTTNDNKDGWFVGYSPKYTTSVWVGYDTPKTITNLYGSIKPVEIWKNIMNNIHKNDRDLSFEKSNSIEYIYINWNGEMMPEGQGYVEIFPKDNLPQKNKYAFEVAAINSYESTIANCNDKEKFIELKAQINADDNLSSSNKTYLINKINDIILSLANLNTTNNIITNDTNDSLNNDINPTNEETIDSNIQEIN